MSAKLGQDALGRGSETFREVSATPCEHFQCPNIDSCRADNKACPAFVIYTNTGRVVDPRSKFSRKPAVVGWIGDWPQPSSEVYRVLHGEDEA